MVYKRIIFALLFYQGSFVLSRNFKRQKVGNWNWLLQKYRLLKALESLDELILLNIDQSEEGFESLLQISRELSQIANLPISIGGGIKNVEMASKAFQSGADKLVLNSLYFQSKNECLKIADKFGSQAITLNFDYKIIDGEPMVFSECGSKPEGKLADIIESISGFNFGELLLRNIDKDGTGFGNDLEMIKDIIKINKPTLIAGGTGKSDHVISTLGSNYIDGIVTANILNFIGNGLVKLRSEVSEKISLAKW